jgi:hypothetical protein
MGKFLIKFQGRLKSWIFGRIYPYKLPIPLTKVFVIALMLPG